MGWKRDEFKYRVVSTHRYPPTTEGIGYYFDTQEEALSFAASSVSGAGAAEVYMISTDNYNQAVENGYFPDTFDYLGQVQNIELDPNRKNAIPPHITKPDGSRENITIKKQFKNNGNKFLATDRSSAKSLFFNSQQDAIAFAKKNTSLEGRMAAAVDICKQSGAEHANKLNNGQYPNVNGKEWARLEHLYQVAQGKLSDPKGQPIEI